MTFSKCHLWIDILNKLPFKLSLNSTPVWWFPMSLKNDKFQAMACSTMADVMACCLITAKPLPKSMLTVNWTLRSKLQGKLNQDTIILFLEETSFENIVCKMSWWHTVWALGLYPKENVLSLFTRFNPHNAFANLIFKWQYFYRDINVFWF